MRHQALRDFFADPEGRRVMISRVLADVGDELVMAPYHALASRVEHGRAGVAGARPPPRRRLRAAIGPALSLTTGRSLSPTTRG
jgi:hypothetical protein